MTTDRYQRGLDRMKELEYLAANPGVEVELTLADRTVDLIDEGYDAVFRVGPLGDSGLIARSLRPMTMVLCAAPAYVEARGILTTPYDLRAANASGSPTALRGPNGLSSGQRVRSPSMSPAGTSSTTARPY